MLALKSKVYNPTFQSRVYMERMFFFIMNKIFHIGYISEKRNNSSAYRIPHKVSVPEECPIARKFSVIAGTFAIPGVI